MATGARLMNADTVLISASLRGPPPWTFATREIPYSYWAVSRRQRCSSTLEMFACGNGTRSVLAMMVPGGSDTWTSMGTVTPPAGALTISPTRPPAVTEIRPEASVLRKVVAEPDPRTRFAISCAWAALHMIAVGEHLTAFQRARNRYCSISVTVPPVRVRPAPLREFQVDGLGVAVPGCAHWPVEV